VTSGAATLKDAMNEAMRDWVTNVADTYYMIGTAAGPHPYPAMVRDFQAVIGNETREQIQELEGRLPDAVVACVGGGSNAIGMFHPFLADESVKIYGVEASGHGLETDKHAASLTGGRPGVLHGNKTYLLQDDDGQILDAHSISAGLDYPGHRAGALVPARHRPGPVPDLHRRRGPEGLPAVRRARGHHPRPGKRPRHRQAAATGQGDRRGRRDRAVPVGPGRQGHLHRGRRPGYGRTI
jgi:hypothetical protein